MQLPQCAENQGGSSASVQHLLGPPSNGRSNGDSQGGKRGCQEVNDSTYSAKDFVSTGTQIVLDKCTYTSVVSTTHSNTPTTSQSDQKLSKNHPGSQESVVVIKLPAEHLTSNPLWAKANDKSPTIAIPSITALHESRPSLGEFQATVTNERPLGAGEQAPISAPPGEIALRSPCLAGSFEGIAAAKPPLVKEITVRLPKCKSPEAQGALEPTQDDQED